MKLNGYKGLWVIEGRGGYIQCILQIQLNEGCVMKAAFQGAFRLRWPSATFDDVAAEICSLRRMQSSVWENPSCTGVSLNVPLGYTLPHSYQLRCANGTSFIVSINLCLLLQCCQKSQNTWHVNSLYFIEAFAVIQILMIMFLKYIYLAYLLLFILFFLIVNTKMTKHVKHWIELNKMNQIQICRHRCSL